MSPLPTSSKKEYGDFQTPQKLANGVVSLVDTLYGTPEIVIEPTAGLGAFLRASAEQWKDRAQYRGYEINRTYIDRARRHLRDFGVQILRRDFFGEDWVCNLAQPGKPRVLVIGNPPWVTNSDLGVLGSVNLPKKSNLVGLRGLDALTGKSNFDIAEWMLVRLMEALPSDGAIAMLCKTMTARKVLRHFWKKDGGREDSSIFLIDAKAEFGVAVDACLFFARGKRTRECVARVYSDIDITSESTRFGFIDGSLVSNIDAYQAHKNLDRGSTTYTWRSGIKHDAAKVMEFTRCGDKLINGFGETVDVEDEYVFPLLKSSDLGNGRIAIRKSVLITQRHIGDETKELEHRAPKTWQYLLNHARILDKRKSSIYATRPRFSLFGIGPYSFAPWKVALSGLYKRIKFTVVPPCKGQPVMVDDTCYFIPCQNEKEATLLFDLVSSAAAKEFLGSLVFFDSKRPITIDVLRKLSFVELARDCGRADEFEEFARPESGGGMDTQMLLPMKP